MANKRMNSILTLAYSEHFFFLIFGMNSQMMRQSIIEAWRCNLCVCVYTVYITNIWTMLSWNDGDGDGGANKERKPIWHILDRICIRYSWNKELSQHMKKQKKMQKVLNITNNSRGRGESRASEQKRKHVHVLREFVFFFLLWFYFI